MPLGISRLKYWQESLALKYHQLTNANALPAIALLGLVTGLIAGLICSLFRLAIDLPLQVLLPGESAESFETLALEWRLLLPIAGALVLGLIFHLLQGNKDNRFGIVHVLERLNHHHAVLPIRNAILQFFTGALALISGQSGGREGPAIHLGATTGSQLGVRLLQPTNITRTLVGCGSAAAISASFNTPIAGVIFAMEVIMMEYSIAGFTPIILAAAGGSFITQLIFGNYSIFATSTTGLYSFLELPLIAILGISSGLLAALFIKICQQGQAYKDTSIILRFLFAGTFTACAAYITPAVLGTGYDTITQSFNAELGIMTLVALVALKLFATSISCAMGMPIGIIGPSLVVGASLGAVFHFLAGYFFTSNSDPSLYALMGMGAMMAAILNAPLAALLAIIEMSNSLPIALPGMFAIVIACTCNASLNRRASVHQAVLHAIGARLKLSPIMQSLQRIGAERIQAETHLFSESKVSLTRAQMLCQMKYQWLIIKTDEGYQALNQLNLKAAITASKPATTEVNLLSLATEYKGIAVIKDQAALDQVWLQMQEKQVELALLEQYHRSLVISKSAIENYLHNHRY